MKKLTEKECEEIYYALCTKRATIKEGRFDIPAEPSSAQPALLNAQLKAKNKQWVRELSAIIRKIGPDGCALYASQK